MKTTHHLLTVALAITLVACGGGGSGSGGDAAPGDGSASVPASALSSVSAFIQFVGAQPADDAATPWDMPEAAPPVTEIDEPVDLS